MSAEFSLDLNSSRRVRSQYPNPCDFVAPISFYDSRLQDPVLLSAPFTASGKPIDSTTTRTSPDAQHIQLDAAEPEIEDFYRGDTLQILGQNHEIIEYDASTQIATLDTALSSTPASGTSYIIRKVNSYFNTQVAIGTVNPVSQSVGNVNLFNASPSTVAGLYDQDYFLFTSSASNSSNSYIVTSYDPLPDNVAFQANPVATASQWLKTTGMYFLLQTAESGSPNDISFQLRCASASSAARSMSISIATTSGTVLGTATVSVSANSTPTDITFNISSITAQLKANTSYRVVLTDVTPGGNATGFLEVFGVALGYTAAKTQLDVVPKFSFSVINSGTSDQVAQQPNSNVVSEWLPCDSPAAFVFNTPGDQVAYQCWYYDFLPLPFDSTNSSRTMAVSFYKGDLIAQGLVNNPPAGQLVYMDQVDIPINTSTVLAPVSVTGGQGASPIQNFMTGTTGPASIITQTQNLQIGPSAQTLVVTSVPSGRYHAANNQFFLQSGSTYPYTSVITPLQNASSDSLQVVLSGEVTNGYTPSVLLHGEQTNSGGFQVFPEKTVTAVLGTPGATYTPFTTTFNYLAADLTNLQANMSVDLLVQLGFQGGSTTYTNLEVQWSLVYEYSAAGAGTGAAFAGNSTYTMLLQDVTAGENTTGYISMLSAAIADVPGSKTTTTHQTFPYFQLQDGTTNTYALDQTGTDPWALQGFLPTNSTEVGYVFQPTSSANLETVVISLFSFEGNGGVRQVVGRIRQGTDLSGPVLETTASVSITNNTDSYAPQAVSFFFSGDTSLVQGTSYVFSLEDVSVSGSNGGGVYVYGVLDDLSAVGWDSTRWHHPWVSAQMTVFAGNHVIYTTAQQPNSNTIGTFVLSKTVPIVSPFQIVYGQEGYVTEIGLQGTSFGSRTLKVTLYNSAMTQLAQYQVNLTDTSSGFSSLVSPAFLTRLADYGSGILATVGSYYLSIVDSTVTDLSSTSGIYLYGSGAAEPLYQIIVPIFSLSFAPPVSFSSFLGDFQDIAEFSTMVQENASTLKGGSALRSGYEWLEVTLDWLSLPNVAIGNGIGGRLDNYSKLYVVLSNDGTVGNVNLIRSNNPDIDQKAVFAVEVSRWEYISTRTFFILRPAGFNPPQILKLSMSEPIRLTLQLPNGETLTFQNQDTVSPAAPNPLLQVSASFRFTSIQEL